VSRALVQVWDRPQCEAGAVALGPLTGWTSANVSQADGAPEQLTITSIPEPVARAASLGEGRLLKVATPLRGVRWWVVLQVTDRDGAGASGVSLTAGPLRYLLAWRGFVRDGTEYAFTPPPDMTAARAIEEYVLNTPLGGSPRPELATDGLGWLSVGSIGWPFPLPLQPFAWKTRAEILRDIEALTGYQITLRPLVPNGSTGFAIDLLPPPSLFPDVSAMLSVGGNVATADRTRDLMRSPSIVTVRPTGAASMGVPSVRIAGVVSGPTPAWIRCNTTVGEFIREPHQFVGAYLRRDNGDTYQITDARVRILQVGAESFALPDVQVADGTGIVDGELVALVRTTTSLPLTEFSSPSAVASRGRVLGVATSPEASLDRNWVTPSADFEFEFPPTTLFGWTLQGGAEVVAYPRAEDVTAWSAQSDGAHVLGATSITLKNAPPERALYGTEVLDLGPGGQKIIADAVVTASSGGALTVTLTSGLDANIADNQAVTAQIVQPGAAGISPRRPNPAEIPLSGNGLRWLRFLAGASSSTMPPPATQRRVQSRPILMHYQTEQPEYNTIRAAAGFSYTYRETGTGEFGNWDAGSVITEDPGLTVTRRLPGIMLVGTPSGTPSRLASAICTTPCPNGGTVSQTISFSHTITANTEVALALLPQAQQSSGRTPFAVCRWASLWLGANETPPVLNGSGADRALMAALDALEAGTARIRLSGVDLEALLADGQDVSLGKRVRLRAAGFDTDRTFIVVRVDWQLADDRTMNVELGAVQPRLTAVTVSV
jgi:hypothetical protein